MSVIVAAYRPGDGFDRVIDSLDAQTLPQDEFELIVVDDGSPDDTVERLRRVAATHPNMRVETIENSGWPSRPRNVGTALARAPYVLYMDHDDSLYPDALRRLVEYAAETHADVVSAKESQTRSVWWGTMPFRHGNVANAIPSGDIHQLMPMIPHKLYRKAFLEEHGIRFPEGKRQLWEDIFFNVEAWRHARVVSLLADTPVYLWHLTEANNSSTYGPGGMEFWNRLDVLYDFIDRTLDGEAFARARQDEFLHQWRGRALKRFAKLAGTAPEERTLRTLPRAQKVQERYVPRELEPLLGVIARPHSELTRIGRIDLLGELWRLDQTVAGRFTASGVRWNEGVLEADVVARWVQANGKPLRVLQRDGRLYRDLPEHIAAALPEDAYDVTDTLDTFILRVGAHSRADHLTWDARVEGAVTTWEQVEPGVVTPVSRGRLRLDPATTAGGRPLTPGVWELSGIVHWSDTARSQGIRVRVKPMPALPGGVVATAYTNKVGTLAIDLNGKARSVIAEGGVRGGRVPGGVRGFVLPLPRVQAWQDARIPVGVRFAPKEGPSTVVAGVLVADGAGARLEAGGEVSPGRYRLAFLPPDGVDRITRWSARVTRGGALVLHDTHLRPRRATLAWLRFQGGRGYRYLRRRLGR
ncbi:glycosyltransferase family 2 protein [Amnibacterium setariae]|uniref:glycosyltransferase family 2 protein n=1 Tax=Amnibacterium setariae TaxID=2306585 RepID=UPI0011C4502C|nr:glycosyltransferase [Amnibacterium setariae]